MGTSPSSITATKAEQKMDKRLGAVRSVFEKLARIITGNRKVSVGLDSPSSGAYHVRAVPPSTPGWTDGERVWLNSDVMKALAEAADFGTMLMRYKGIFYHEVAHILYTPRDNTEPVTEILNRCGGGSRSPRAVSLQDPTWWWAFNALEDQRIETLFASVYGQSKRYFEAAALEWLVKPDTELELAHLLVRGRKYLAVEVRDAARQALIDHIGGQKGELIAAEADGIIDTYLSLEFPKDSQKGFQLVRRYRDLMAKVGLTHQHTQPSMDNDPQNIPSRKSQAVVRKGRPSSDKQKEAQKERVEKPEPKPRPKPKGNESNDDPKPKPKKQEEDEKSDDLPKRDEEGNVESDSDDNGDDLTGESESTQQGGDDQSGDASTETDDEGDGDGQGDGDGDGESSHGESPSTGNDPSGGSDGEEGQDGQSEGSDTEQSNPGEGVGTGSGAATMTAEEFIEMIEAAIEVLMSDEEFAADLDATVTAVIQASGADDGLGGGHAPYRDVTIPTTGRSTVRKISTELAQLRLELDDFRESRQTAGRFSVRDAMVAQPWEVNVFNRWHAGDEEAGGFEVVVLLDLSGSMNGTKLAEASLAMWCLKRAFDELKIKTTVLGYSDDWSVLYRPGEKASKGDMRLFSDQGGTNPYGALQHAYRILSQSQCQNRLLVSVTDGGWSHVGGNPDDVVSAINAIEGATTLLVGINDASYPRWKCVETYGDHNHQLAVDLDSATELPKVVNDLVKRMMRKAITGVHLHG